MIADNCMCISKPVVNLKHNSTLISTFILHPTFEFKTAKNYRPHDSYNIVRIYRTPFVKCSVLILFEHSYCYFRHYCRRSIIYSCIIIKNSFELL